MLTLPALAALPGHSEGSSPPGALALCSFLAILGLPGDTDGTQSLLPAGSLRSPDETGGRRSSCVGSARLWQRVSGPRLSWGASAGAGLPRGCPALCRAARGQLLSLLLPAPRLCPWPREPSPRPLLPRLLTSCVGVSFCLALEARGCFSQATRWWPPSPDVPAGGGGRWCRPREPPALVAQRF